MANGKPTALTGTDIKNITLEILNGTPSGITGEEADALRESLRKTVAEAKAAGGYVDVPYDFTD